MELHGQYILSCAALLFLLMDPFGNLPLFISTLRHLPGERYPRIVLRESFVALGLMFCFLFAGARLLKLLQLSQSSLNIAGGVILLLMAIKMVFSTLAFQTESGESVTKEPFIVPLAVPLICGPALITMLIVTGSRGTVPDNICAVVLAWLPQTAVLLFGRMLSRILGSRVLDALESLMGLLLSCTAVEMLVSGIRIAFSLK